MSNIYIEKQDIHCTLTTFVYCSFAQLWAAEQLGHTAYINWHQNGGSVLSYEDKEMFAREPNQYNWWFKQPMIQHPPPANSERWTWEIAGEWSPYNLMNQPLHVIKDYYKKHLYFNDTVNARGQQLVEKYKIDFSKTIGITWRGTDIYLDGRPYMPIETYFPFIDEVLKDNMRIMCTAEEQGILEPLLKRYPQAFVIEEFIQAPKGSKDNPERFSQVSGFERGLQPALMVWLFSKAAHYIKNRSSTGAVASWLSDGRIVCLGHEENLSYDLSYNYVEIEGKRYPLDI